MQDAGVDQELRMCEVGHADRSTNDRYTHPLEQAHLAASERTAALVRKARTESDRDRCSHSVPIRSCSREVTVFRKGFRRSSGVVGRVGLEPTTGRL